MVRIKKIMIVMIIVAWTQTQIKIYTKFIIFVNTNRCIIKNRKAQINSALN